MQETFLVQSLGLMLLQPHPRGEASEDDEGRAVSGDDHVLTSDAGRAAHSARPLLQQ